MKKGPENTPAFSFEVNKMTTYLLDFAIHAEKNVSAT